ncbi:hypothetical protein ABIE67_010012 [Streptomyces sp. V4I8]
MVGGRWLRAAYAWETVFAQVRKSPWAHVVSACSRSASVAAVRRSRWNRRSTPGTSAGTRRGTCCQASIRMPVREPGPGCARPGTAPERFQRWGRRRAGVGSPVPGWRCAARRPRRVKTEGSGGVARSRARSPSAGTGTLGTAVSTGRPLSHGRSTPGSSHRPSQLGDPLRGQDGRHAARECGGEGKPAAEASSSRAQDQERRGAVATTMGEARVGMARPASGGPGMCAGRLLWGRSAPCRVPPVAPAPVGAFTSRSVVYLWDLLLR